MAPRALNLGTRRKWVVSFIEGRSTGGEKAPHARWIRGYVGPRISLNDVENKLSLALNPICTSNEGL